MTEHPHLLHLEDDPIDVELVRLRLEADGLRCTIHAVQTRRDFRSALAAGGIDLVLADYRLPGFDGMEALSMVKEIAPDLPFVLVSGFIGEESAVEVLKSGATDYILKDRMSRLAPAVRRALDEARTGREARVARELATRSQKMEIFAQLAGGLAHDFNNILTVIAANCGLLLEKLPARSAAHSYAEQAESAAEKASALVRQLLVFSRHESPAPVEFDLNELVDTSQKLLRRLLPKMTALHVCPAPSGLVIVADPGRVEQVLMNLVLNARDAMPDGGTIEVATGRVALDSGDPGLPPGNLVSLSVTDTGTGMTDEVKARLFEPFFTTKPPGAGTGLGLITCQRIITEAGGRILASSEPGKGSTFTVLLPAAAVRERPVRVLASRTALPEEGKNGLAEPGDGKRLSKKPGVLDA